MVVQSVPVERFIYRPIDLTGKSLRLLRIIHADSGIIKCELFDAWLEDDGGIIEYDALSYTWGGSEKVQEVIINDKSFQVTANLSQALQDLRYPDRDRILWIDAICIDQDNDPERGHQVQQMSLIYKRAERVIIWLGFSTLSTDLAFDHMQRLEDRASGHAYNNWTTKDARWLDIWQKVNSDMNIGPGSAFLSLIASDLKNLLKRPWFERVWIIQEVANAKSGRVVCGDRSVSMRIFAVFPTLMGITLDAQCQSIMDVMPGSTRKNSWWTKKHDLHTLLVKFRGSKASDPRDKIYALLGISSDVRGTEILTADYEKPLLEIIHDTAFYLLGLDGNQRPLLPLPTWTMDEFLRDLEFLDDRLLLWASEHGHEALLNYLLDIRKANVNFEDEQLRTSLSCAAYADHGRIVEKLLKSEIIDINIPDNTEMTPLLIATSKWHYDVAQQLLDTGRANLNPIGPRGLTVLKCAVQNRNVKMVKQILKFKDVDVNRAGEDGETALMIAAKSGAEEMVSLLLDRDDIEVDVKDTYDRTALSWAAKHRFKKIAACLLDKGNADTEIPDRWGWRPLWIAAMAEDAGVVDVMHERLAEKRRSDNWILLGKEQELTTLLLRLASRPTHLITHKGRTPLWWAVINGLDEVVDLLILTGKVNVHDEDSLGRSVLFWLAESGCNTNAIEQLLDGRPKDVRITRNRGREMSDFMESVFAGHQAILEKLLAANLFDVNARGELGRTPLCIAALNGNGAMTRILLAAEAIDVDVRDDLQITPFIHAVSSGSCAVVWLLFRTLKVDLKSHDTGLAAARQLARGGDMIRLLEDYPRALYVH